MPSILIRMFWMPQTDRILIFPGSPGPDVYKRQLSFFLLRPYATAVTLAAGVCRQAHQAGKSWEMCIRDRGKGLPEVQPGQLPRAWSACVRLSAGAGFLRPVSYTHLDVYKRQD